MYRVLFYTGTTLRLKNHRLRFFHPAGCVAHPSREMVFVSLVSLGLTLSAPSTSQGLTRPPAVRRHASVTSIAVDAEPAIRIGHGYDIHRLASREEAGQPLVIAGVKFDGSDAPNFELGCVAHSDGDVIYHSVVTARPLEPAHLRVATLRDDALVPTGGRDSGRADHAGHRPALPGQRPPPAARQLGDLHGGGAHPSAHPSALTLAD